VHAQTVDVNRVFHALSDATRRQMIERLSEGPVSASELAKPLGVSLAAVVQHLQLLEGCSLVRSEKVGRTRLCRMEPAGLRGVGPVGALREYPLAMVAWLVTGALAFVFQWTETARLADQQLDGEPA